MVISSLSPRLYLAAELTCDMQEECGRIITQCVLCQRCDTEYPSGLVYVFDPLLSPAQVGVGHGCAVTKIQLDVSLQGVTLKRHSGTSVSYR